MTKIDIIMLNMSSYSDWQRGIQNRNYHILHTLQKSPMVNKIIAVDFLPFTTKLALKRFAKDIVLNKDRGEVIYGDATSLCHQVTSKIYVYSTIDSLLNQNIVTKELQKISKILKLHKPILWSYHPLFTKMFGELNESMIVFDTVDNWLEHSAYVAPKYQERLTANYKKISQQADVIFTVAENLKDFYASFNRHESIHYIANGMDGDYFTDKNLKTADTIEFFEQPEIKGKPVIGYIGTIQNNRIDFDLLAYAAKRHPDKIFALCGPIWKESQDIVEKNLKKFDNIHLLGPVPRKKWIDYCKYFDIAINPHKDNQFTKYTCPTKIYEYLACGKPVLSTKVCGTDAFDEEITVAHSRKEFSEAIDTILTESPHIHENLIEHAREHYTWANRIDQMLEIITTHPNFDQ